MPKLNDVKETISSLHKTLLILCGLPYAGKSYVAEQILNETDSLVFVSIDEIFHRKRFDWNSNILPDTNTWKLIFTESYEQTRQALLDGKNVLYDSTNQTVASRDKLREVALSVDASTKVVYVKSSIENVWGRWEKNQESLSRSIVSKELVQQTIDMFEEPEEWENVYIINN